MAKSTFDELSTEQKFTAIRNDLRRILAMIGDLAQRVDELADEVKATKRKTKRRV